MSNEELDALGCCCREVHLWEGQPVLHGEHCQARAVGVVNVTFPGDPNLCRLCSEWCVGSILAVGQDWPENPVHRRIIGETENRALLRKEPTNRRRMLRVFDTLVTGIDQDLKGIGYVSAGRSLATRAALFGQQNIGYGKLSNIQAGNCFPNDHHVSITAVRTVIRMPTEELVEDVKHALQWTLEVAYYPVTGGFVDDMEVPLSVKVFIPPRIHYAVQMEWMDDAVLRAVYKTPGKKLIRFELHGEETRTL